MATVVHEIAPNLARTMRGEFQVRLGGIRSTRGGVMACEVALLLADPKAPGVVLHEFCRAAITPGRSITLGNETAITFDVPGHPAKVAGVFQARVIGAAATAAEIELRMVDPENHESAVMSFGSATIAVGKHIQLAEQEIVVTIERAIAA